MVINSVYFYFMTVTLTSGSKWL